MDPNKLPSKPLNYPSPISTNLYDWHYLGSALSPNLYLTPANLQRVGNQLGWVTPPDLYAFFKDHYASSPKEDVLAYLAHYEHV